MTTTVANLITLFDTHIDDTSNDRITAADRLQYAEEAIEWLQLETGNDHMVRTYTFTYYDDTHRYRITEDVASLIEASSLRRAENLHDNTFAHKTPEEMAIEIGRGFNEKSWTIQYQNDDWYIVTNYQNNYNIDDVTTISSLTESNGTWTANTSTSDATNLTLDDSFVTSLGNALNFDLNVAQSGNNTASVYITKDSIDLSNYEGNSAFRFYIDLPDPTYITSISLFVGTDSSNYYLGIATAQHGGAAFIEGTNTIIIPFKDMTIVGSPVSTNITYVRHDIDYTASQTNATDIRIYATEIVEQEELTFYYTSSYVGKSSTGALITSFTATTDIPYFSDKHDKYKFAVAHKMAAIAYGGKLRNLEQFKVHSSLATGYIDKKKKIFGNPVTKIMNSFKPLGVNFSRGRRR